MFDSTKPTLPTQSTPSSKPQSLPHPPRRPKQPIIKIPPRHHLQADRRPHIIILLPHPPHMLALPTQRHIITRVPLAPFSSFHSYGRREDETRVIHKIPQRSIIPIQRCIMCRRWPEEHGAENVVDILGVPVFDELDAEVVALQPLLKHLRSSELFVGLA